MVTEIKFVSMLVVEFEDLGNLLIDVGHGGGFECFWKKMSSALQLFTIICMPRK